MDKTHVVNNLFVKVFVRNIKAPTIKSEVQMLAVKYNVKGKVQIIIFIYTAQPKYC